MDAGIEHAVSQLRLLTTRYKTGDYSPETCLDLLTHAKYLQDVSTLDAVTYSNFLGIPGSTKEEVYRGFERWVADNCGFRPLAWFLEVVRARRLPDGIELQAPIMTTALLQTLRRAVQHQLLSNLHSRLHVLEGSHVEILGTYLVYSILGALIPGSGIPAYIDRTPESERGRLPELVQVQIPRYTFPIRIPNANLHRVNEQFTAQNNYRYLNALLDTYARYNQRGDIISGLGAKRDQIYHLYFELGNAWPLRSRGDFLAAWNWLLVTYEDNPTLLTDPIRENIETLHTDIAEAGEEFSPNSVLSRTLVRLILDLKSKMLSVEWSDSDADIPRFSYLNSYRLDSL